MNLHKLLDELKLFHDPVYVWSEITSGQNPHNDGLLFLMKVGDHYVEIRHKTNTARCYLVSLWDKSFKDLIEYAKAKSIGRAYQFINLFEKKEINHRLHTLFQVHSKVR